MKTCASPVPVYTLAARKTALLVIDLQNDFCHPRGYLARERGAAVGFAGPVVDEIACLIGEARKASVPVIWIRSYYDFKYLSAAAIAKRGAEGCCMEGQWGSEFFRLVPSEQDILVSKHTFSGFHKTNLGNVLHSLNVETLVISGVATNVCVDSTLREGFFLGFNIILFEDGVGSASEIGHRGTLATVRNNFGAVMSAPEIIRVWESDDREDGITVPEVASDDRSSLRQT